MIAIHTKDRWKRDIKAADNHGNIICPHTSKAFFKFISDWKPDIHIHMGDNWNFDCLRSGATPEEQNIDLDSDFNDGLDFLNEFRPDHFLLGNHDWRLWKLLKSVNAKDRSFANDKIQTINRFLKLFNIKTYDWGVKPGFFKLAGQTMIHGYSSGFASANKMSQIYGPVCQGHNHTSEITALQHINGGFAQTVPSLCDNDRMEYQRGQPASTKHISGWGLGLSDTKRNKYYCGYVIKDGDNFIVNEPRVI